jgi:2-polyprenyl-6-hydroxyphenyl methylase/3-demethylubiquinone-9 3-methyltransferase
MTLCKANSALTGRNTTGGAPVAGRFAFGENWRSFVRSLNEAQIEAATTSLAALLQQRELRGRRFLDIGCGSGLSSLAAHRLGASVHSFDYDPDSVTASRSLREKYAPRAESWLIERGSAIEPDYMNALGRFDIVYAWGVLHHTGEMWRAIELAAGAVAPGGCLALGLYNDQGGGSQRWLTVKRTYVRSPRPVRWAMVAAIGLFFELRTMAIRAIRLQNPLPFADWRRRREDRGMSAFHDLVDWVGGYPFEVARPETVFDFLRERGFVLEGLKTSAGGHGCNEFLFIRGAKH